jgi:hypothetical protein
MEAGAIFAHNSILPIGTLVLFIARSLQTINLCYLWQVALGNRMYPGYT